MPTSKHRRKGRTRHKSVPLQTRPSSVARFDTDEQVDAIEWACLRTISMADIEKPLGFARTEEEARAVFTRAGYEASEESGHLIIRTRLSTNQEPILHPSGCQMRVWLLGGMNTQAGDLLDPDLLFKRQGGFFDEDKS